MHRYVNSMQTVLTIPISKGIVEVIIGDMFFKPELDEDDEEMELIIKTNALKLFHQQDDGSYVAKVSNKVLYNLTLQHMSVGLSFRQTSTVIGQHKDVFGNGNSWASMITRSARWSASTSVPTCRSCRMS